MPEGRGLSFPFSTSCAAILEREPAYPGVSLQMGGWGEVQNVIKKIKVLGKKLKEKGLLRSKD